MSKVYQGGRSVRIHRSRRLFLFLSPLCDYFLKRLGIRLLLVL